MWQSLSFGANYKAAYCMAVCPAGDDFVAPFREDRKSYLEETVRPLQRKEETVYVLAGSDAEVHVAKRFPHKKAKRVGNSLRPRSIRGFLESLPLVFQRDRAADLDATYHFRFTGDESQEATIRIRHRTLEIEDGFQGKADLRVTADSRVWLGFLNQERNLLWALVRGKIRLWGSPRLLLAFGRAFLG